MLELIREGERGGRVGTDFAELIGLTGAFWTVGLEGVLG